MTKPAKTKPAKAKPAKTKPTGRGDRFTASVIEGHGGVRAFYVPFDPGAVWGSELVTWTHPLFDGEQRKGYRARIRIGDYAFDGFIGYRWKRLFILVDEPMIAALGLDSGDEVAAEVWPRSLVTIAPSKAVRSSVRRAPAKRTSAGRTRKPPAR